MPLRRSTDETSTRDPRAGQEQHYRKDSLRTPVAYSGGLPEITE